ncbi:MAG: SUMF1/EgtB/PvdO family nonheme iron enzyme [Treponemataceae bacterium]|nr:SUMF1/EgtB/PvdO family nonheme iron enzyme [Treponemataceae bacterium]
MKICPKCKNLYENGNFCESCENEDGSPVELEEEKVKCPRCGRGYNRGTKFCSECGVKLGAGGNSSNGSGISMGDKNVIAGDVIGHKENYSVSGNATIIHNEDETKKTAKCHICGSIVQKIHGYDCPDCGEFTCEDCFDKKHGICRNCEENKIKRNEENYRSKVIEFLSDDNRIDADEFKVLQEYQKQYELSDFRAMEIQDEVKNNSRGNIEFSTFEKLNFEKAEELFYEEGNSGEALALLEPIYKSHPKDEKVVSLYLPVLVNQDKERAKKIISEIKTDEAAVYLAAIEIAIQERDMDTAERRLLEAEKIWPESVLVKCHKALYMLALYEQFESDEWLEKAVEQSQNLGNPTSKLELSWQVKVQCMVSETCGEEALSLDRDFCRNNQLYYGFLKKDLFLKEELFEKKESSVEMVLVEGGTIDAGSSYITVQSFMIGKYPVTQKEWVEIMGKSPFEYRKEGERRPAVNVNWFDAIEFCNKLSEKDGLIPAYRITIAEREVGEDDGYDHIKAAEIEENEFANGYRLPTCDEWEFAARGGTKTHEYTYSGSDDLNEVAWWKGNSKNRPHDVGTKKPNELEIYDMTGNVNEWCWDSNVSIYGYDRYSRGGSYGDDYYYDDDDDDYWEVSYWRDNYAQHQYDDVGFRIVRSVSD